MVKTAIVFSPAQASALLTAYHVLDEIITHMEEHDLEDSRICGFAFNALDGLGNVLESEDTIWDNKAVVLKEEV